MPCCTEAETLFCVVRRGVDVSRAAAWTAGRLAFDDRAFSDVAAELSRWFDVDIRIADLKVKRFAAGGGRGAILGQVVHNERVVEEMERLGVRTVEDLLRILRR